ncbi:hypothetical protein ACH5RR_034287 [Cinchona calisaya]|uniref:Uncharacterized protein n=1 Tax=Cinchona calisaya TaxID=153742 RepID=A0ABD2YCM3_9GENT
MLSMVPSIRSTDMDDQSVDLGIDILKGEEAGWGGVVIENNVVKLDSRIWWNIDSGKLNYYLKMGEEAGCDGGVIEDNGVILVSIQE